MRLLAKSSIAAAVNGLLLLAVIGLLIWGNWKQTAAYQTYDRANAVRNQVSVFGSLAMEAMQRPSERVAKQWANEAENVRNSLKVSIAEGDADAIQLDKLVIELSHAFTEIVFRGQAAKPQLRRIQIGRLIAKLHQMSDLANQLVESSREDRVQASKMLKTSVWTAASLLILGVPLLWLGFRMAALRPLARLTKEVSEASLAHPLRTDTWTSKDEFGILGREFAEMQNRLKTAYDEVADKAERLEISTKEAQKAAESAKVAERRATEALDAMRQAQEENVWAARHDALTNLGNRTLLEETTERFEVTDKETSGILVMAIDLDRFKDVNDTYGHEAGDMVLRACGERLKARLQGSKDFAFRIGGDEFVLCLEFSGSETHAQWYCDLLLDDMLRPVPYTELELQVGASIGFSLLAPGEALNQTLKRADLALYEAKSRGRNQAIAYSDTLGAAHEAKLSLINDFKTALERDEITIEVQPQVCASDHHLCGIEVLARWDHPMRGRQSPMVFLDIAEELKLQAELDRRVLDLALAARRLILTEIGYAPQVSVNVSARRLTSVGLLDELTARNDLPTEGLVFEILETAFLDSVSSDLEATIEGLKQLGIKIEVDDFGTGHASFASVLALKPDGLKIDRMFVTGIDQSEERRALLRGIIDMADRVAVPTVVEGVETMAEAQTAAELGAGTLQGYAFAKPMVVEDFVAWARAWSRNVA